MATLTGAFAGAFAAVFAEELPDWARRAGRAAMESAAAQAAT